MPSPNPDQSSTNVTEMMERAEAAFGTGDLQGAIRACQKVLAVSLDNRRAKEIMETAQSMLEAEAFIKENLRRARDFFNARDFEKCINECQKIQILQQDNPTVSELMNQAKEKLEAEPFVLNFIRSGQSLFDSGLFGEALSQWEKVRSIDPHYPELETLIAKAQEKVGGPSPGKGSATPLFDMNIEPSPSAPGSGFDELDLSNLEGTASEDQRILQLLTEGDRLYESEQYQKAIETWSEIFMLDVNHPTALQKIEQARGAENEQRNRMKETLKTAQRTYEQGNTRQAYELFMQVKAIDPDNTEANKYLSMMEAPTSPAAPGASTEEPELKELIALGESAQQSGQYREAAQYYSQALAIDTDNANLADAIRNLNLLAKKNEQTKALLGNARAFKAEGKLDSAYHALNKAMDLDPGNPEVQQMLQDLKSPAPEPPTAKTQPLSVSADTFRAARPFPVMRIGIGAAVLLALFLGYFFFMRGGPSANEGTQPLVKTPKTPGITTPGTEKPSTTTPAAPKTPPANAEKAEQLAKQANFFFGDKKYSQAVKMADEALKFDPENKEAISVKMLAHQALRDQALLERKLLDDANLYFGYAEYAGAAKLYLKYIEAHPDAKPEVMPQVVKCYYNMGVISLRQWKCDLAADYFNQVIFLGENDSLSKDALEVAHQCQKAGTSNFEVRKAVALLEIRK